MVRQTYFIVYFAFMLSNFTTAAKKAMPAVVHISSVESEQLAQERRQDQDRSNPFRQFFGDD